MNSLVVGSIAAQSFSGYTHYESARRSYLRIPHPLGKVDVHRAATPPTIRGAFLAVKHACSRSRHRRGRGDAHIDDVADMEGCPRDDRTDVLIFGVELAVVTQIHQDRRGHR